MVAKAQVLVTKDQELSAKENEIIHLKQKVLELSQNRSTIHCNNYNSHNYYSSNNNNNNGNSNGNNNNNNSNGNNNGNSNGNNNGNINGNNNDNNRAWLNVNVSREIATAYNNPISFSTKSHQHDGAPLHGNITQATDTSRFTNQARHQPNQRKASSRPDYRSSSYATENDELATEPGLQCPICKSNFSGRQRLAVHVFNCKGTLM